MRRQDAHGYDDHAVVWTETETDTKLKASKNGKRAVQREIRGLAGVLATKQRGKENNTDDDSGDDSTLVLSQSQPAFSSWLGGSGGPPSSPGTHSKRKQAAAGGSSDAAKRSKLQLQQ